MSEKFNELLLKPDIIELYNEGITPNYGYLLNGRLEKDMIRTLYPLQTLNGNPITWEASETELLFPSVSLQPKQAGSGDPSPENVRPISGYDSVSVNVRGKNLFNISKIESNHKITNNGDGSLTISTGIGTSAANSGKTLRELCNGITPGTYTINAESTGSDKFVYTSVIGKWDYGTSKTLTDEMLDSQLYFYASGVETTATISNIQLELGSTPTPYEPYQPGTTATLTLPETIYGGTVDAVTGVGSYLYLFKELAIADMDNNDTYPGWRDQDWVTQVVPGEIADKTLAALGCEGVINITTTSGFRVNPKFDLYLSPDNNVFPGLTQSQIKEQYPDLVVQFCLKLATPAPFQATGNQQLTSLLGYNTIYTDGNSMVLNRKARRLEV